ncbi:MAG: lamin tail domain-containing protein [Chloroflexi bacterium]|nr:lamin tail domain-containing protein [Chloroflexota bacterium]MBU1751370.1 lamin tail domain-containing protein [Chloroflexota bacterium]
MPMYQSRLRIMCAVVILLILVTIIPATSVIGKPLAQTGSPTIVISEFRTRGPNGGNDEFIELYNRSSVTTVDVGSWEVWGSNSSGTTSNRLTITAGTILGPGCRYLLTNSSTSGGPYSGSTPGDQTYATGITDNGGIAVCSGPCSTLANIVDQVGMSAGSAYKEGTTLTPMSVSQDQSFERLPLHGDPTSVNTQDTDDNGIDFFFNSGISNPENMASSCTPSAVNLASLGATSNGAASAILLLAVGLATTIPAGALLLRRRRR